MAQGGVGYVEGQWKYYRKTSDREELVASPEIEPQQTYDQAQKRKNIPSE